MTSQDEVPEVQRPVPQRTASMLRDGAAVLGAILVAFGLDAWWDGRQEAEQTDELIAAIAVEFEAAVVGLDSIIAENDRFIASRVVYLERTEPGSPRIPDDSLAHYIDLGRQFQAYDPVFGALRTLISIGGLERIHNAELRYALGGWSGELADLEWEYQQLFLAHQALLESLALARAMSEVALGWPFDAPRMDQASRLLARSEDYRQAAARVVMTLRFYQDDLLRIRRKTSELTRMLVGE